MAALGTPDSITYLSSVGQAPPGGLPGLFVVRLGWTVTSSALAIDAASPVSGWIGAGATQLPTGTRVLGMVGWGFDENTGFMQRDIAGTPIGVQPVLLTDDGAPTLAFQNLATTGLVAEPGATTNIITLDTTTTPNTFYLNLLCVLP